MAFGGSVAYVWNWVQSVYSLSFNKNVSVNKIMSIFFFLQNAMTSSGNLSMPLALSWAIFNGILVCRVFGWWRW